MLWFAVVALIGLCGLVAVVMGARGRTTLHRVALWSGVLAVMGAIVFVPVALYASIDVIASVRSDPLEEVLLGSYVVGLGLCGLLSAVSSLRLGTRKAA